MTQVADSHVNPKLRGTVKHMDRLQDVRGVWFHAEVMFDIHDHGWLTPWPIPTVVKRWHHYHMVAQL